MSVEAEAIIVMIIFAVIMIYLFVNFVDEDNDKVNFN
jgi:hypothetical protein|tara:strand:- start:3 stop:113 length:111 start_codon:yes stop_codon:yes gene_type:complete